MQQSTFASFTRFTREIFAGNMESRSAESRAPLPDAGMPSTPRYSGGATFASDDVQFTAEFAALRLPESRAAVQQLLATLRDVETSLGAAPK